MSAFPDPSRAEHGRRALLDFTDLPAGSRALCLGPEAADLVRLLRRRGHRAVGLGEGPPSPPARHLVRGRRTALPFADGAFGIVFCVEALSAEDPERILSEAVRVVRSGGLLAVREALRGSRLTVEELCAHAAGERLALIAHREEPSPGQAGTASGSWLLQVPEAGRTPVRREER